MWFHVSPGKCRSVFTIIYEQKYWPSSTIHKLQGVARGLVHLCFEYTQEQRFLNDFGLRIQCLTTISMIFFFYSPVVQAECPLLKLLTVISWPFLGKPGSVPILTYYSQCCQNVNLLPNPVFHSTPHVWNGKTALEKTANKTADEITSNDSVSFYFFFVCGVLHVTCLFNGNQQKLGQHH